MAVEPWEHMGNARNVERRCFSDMRHLGISVPRHDDVKRQLRLRPREHQDHLEKLACGRVHTRIGSFLGCTDMRSRAPATFKGQIR